MFRTPPPPIVRPKVTPDPEAAAILERRLSEVAYCPEVPFHRDQRTPRKWRRA